MENNIKKFVYASATKTAITSAAETGFDFERKLKKHSKRLPAVTSFSLALSLQNQNELSQAYYMRALSEVLVEYKTQ